MASYYRGFKVIRRSRKLLGNSDFWRQRFVFWFGAILIGFISVGFAHAADWGQGVFGALLVVNHWTPFLPLLITPLGFILSAWLAQRYFPNSQGSGIPQAIAARHLNLDEDRLRLLSPKIAFGKICLTIVGLLSGASIGREGPTVQVGASVMLGVARFGGLSRTRGLILAGSAAGIAAAFNTPLAGIVFAIEEMSKAYEARINSLVLLAVVFSGIAALGLSGSYSYFGTTSAAPNDYKDWLAVMLCGVAGGALGAAFSAAALFFGARIRYWTQSAPLRRMIIIAGTCGFAVAIIGVLSGGNTFGTGYEQAKSAIGGQALPALFFIEKFMTSFLSMMSGIPGGIFAPSLAVGAGLGSTIGLILGSNIGLAAILGMAGYFAGVVQAPMTAFVIIVEMTNDHQAVIPIMAAAMIGYLTSRIFSREPLYHGLSRVFVAAALKSHRTATK